VPEPTDFVQRRVDALTRAEVASDDMCGLGRRMRWLFAVEAHPRVALSNAIKERAADQPTAAGNNQCSQPRFDCRSFIHIPTAVFIRRAEA
jgi:hypothetical protein